MLPFALALLEPAAPLGQFLFAAGFGLIFLIIGVLTSIFWIWMLIDCLVSRRDPMEKLVWVLVILFTHVIGAIIYFVIGRTDTGGGARGY